MGKDAKIAKAAKSAEEKAASKAYVKIIKAFKSPKTGAYAFKEAMVHKDNVKNFLEQD